MVLPTTEIIEPFKWTAAIGSVAQYALFKSAGAAVKSIRKSSISSADDVSLKTNLDNDVVDLSSSKSNNLTLKTGSDLSIPKTQNHVDVPSSVKSHVDVPTSGVADAELAKVKHTADLNLSTKSTVNVPTSKTADNDLPTVKSHTDMNLSSKTVSNAATAAAVSGVKPGDVDVPKVKGELAQSTHGSAIPSVESVTPRELIPGTPEHKAQRWKDYQARDNAGWSYERWSKQYDINMRNASYGLSRERKYREVFGGESRVLKTDFTLRQIDIADGTSLKQLKTGKVSLTKQAKIDIQKDAWLMDEGYHVEYILEKGASKPFLNALDENNIPYTIGSLLDN